jgi:N-acetylneuraminic acid mutarotase
VIAGYDGLYCSDVHELDLLELNWKKIETTGDFEGRYYHSCVVYRHFAFLFGGKKKNSFFKGILSLNLNTNEWKQINTTGTEPMSRYFSEIFVKNGKLYCFGGFNGVPLNDLFFLDLKTFEWKEISIQGSILPEKRSGHKCKMKKLTYV